MEKKQNKKVEKEKNKDNHSREEIIARRKEGRGYEKEKEEEK